MKFPTPIITLIVGAALAVALLFDSMTAVSAKKAALAAASASAAASAGSVATASAQPTGASATTAHSPSASPSASPSGFVIPPHANYVGQVQGDLGSVAIVVHD